MTNFDKLKGTRVPVWHDGPPHGPGIRWTPLGEIPEIPDTARVMVVSGWGAK